MKIIEKALQGVLGEKKTENGFNSFSIFIKKVMFGNVD